MMMRASARSPAAWASQAKVHKDRWKGVWCTVFEATPPGQGRSAWTCRHEHLRGRILASATDSVQRARSNLCASSPALGHLHRSLRSRAWGNPIRVHRAFSGSARGPTSPSSWLVEPTLMPALQPQPDGAGRKHHARGGEARAHEGNQPSPATVSALTHKGLRPAPRQLEKTWTALRGRAGAHFPGWPE